MGTRTPQAAGPAAGPEEPVPVALLARTSTLELQDPVASLNRQIRSCTTWLPAGWYIAAHYWDIESGGIDLEDRSQGEAYKQFTAVGIPRDGGIADLLAHAKAPLPPFAAVICEDIERSGRDTYNALKLEKELSRQGIALFATDEPPAIAGVNSTAILVRRVKQGVSEWLRLQIKEKAWKGLQEHTIAGWNIGTPPYGYLAEKITHPVPAKAAQGATKTRLITDPGRGPVITQIFTWRVRDKLGVPTIAARLAADPALYPPPDDRPWCASTVRSMLANPKYTGYMVFGRTSKSSGKTTTLPQDQWLWSPEPTHPALTDLETWQAAQSTGTERGNVRDPEMPTTQPGRRYPLRSRIRCNKCRRHRRMTGVTRSIHKPGRHYAYTYYQCPHDPKNPRHAAAQPDHGRVYIREDTIVAAIRDFLATRVFGPGRAALLAAQLPATDAEHAEQQARHAARLRQEITQIDTSETGLITELAQLGSDTSPATQAYRARIRTQHAELFEQRASKETELAAIETTAPAGNDPDLLSQLPHAADLINQAPSHIMAALYEAFDIQILYRPDQHQATIWATLTTATPQTIKDLLTDPRTDHDTHTAPATQFELKAAAPAASTGELSHSAHIPRCPWL